MSTKAMVAGDRNQLRTCEKTIERGMATFVDVGKALAKIKEKKLYRDTHGTFDIYCQERWGRGRQWAHVTMEAAGVVESLAARPVENVNNCLQKEPPELPVPNAGQARALAKVPEESRPEVWVEANKDGKPTAAKVAEAAVKAKVVPPPPEKKKRPPKNGAPLISTAHRKAVKSALGALVRALHSCNIYDDFAEPMEAICEKIETL